MQTLEILMENQFFILMDIPAQDWRQKQVKRAYKKVVSA